MRSTRVSGISELPLSAFGAVEDESVVLSRYARHRSLSAGSQTSSHSMHRAIPTNGSALMLAQIVVD
jgi:hypothetical protein